MHNIVAVYMIETAGCRPVVAEFPKRIMNEASFCGFDWIDARQLGCIYACSPKCAEEALAPPGLHESTPVPDLIAERIKPDPRLVMAAAEDRRGAERAAAAAAREGEANEEGDGAHDLLMGSPGGSLGGSPAGVKTKSYIPTAFKSRLLKDVDGGSNTWGPVLRALPEPLRQQLTTKPAAKKRKRATPSSANAGSGRSKRRTPAAEVTEGAALPPAADDDGGITDEDDVVVTGYTTPCPLPGRVPSSLPVVIIDSDTE